MTLSVDLNADLGESFGPWPMGHDEALLEVISSANVACGVHAGDWDVMAQTMARARQPLRCGNAPPRRPGRRPPGPASGWRLSLLHL